MIAYPQSLCGAGSVQPPSLPTRQTLQVVDELTARIVLVLTPACDGTTHWERGGFMATRIFIGGLPFSVTDDQLLQLFSPYGEVTEATVAVDRSTTRSKGFGFVQMTDDAAAQQAITALDGSTLSSRTITVSLAKPRTERPERRW
jgi:hypothetical protein